MINVKNIMLDLLLVIFIIFLYWLGLSAFPLFYKIKFSGIDINSTLHLLKSYYLWCIFLISLGTILILFSIFYFIITLIYKIAYCKKHYGRILFIHILQAIFSNILALLIILVSITGAYIIYSEGLITIQEDYKLAIEQVENKQLENVDTYLVKVEKDFLPGIYLPKGEYACLATLNIKQPVDYAYYKQKDYYVYDRVYIPTNFLKDLDIPIQDLSDYTKEEYKSFSKKYNITYTTVEGLKIAVDIKEI